MRLRLGPLGAPATIVIAWVTVRIVMLMPPPDKAAMPGLPPVGVAAVPRGYSPPPPVQADIGLVTSQSSLRSMTNTFPLNRHEARTAILSSPTLDPALAATPYPADPPRAAPAFQGRSGIVAGYSPPQRPPHRAFTGTGWALINGTGGAIGVPSLGGSQMGMRLFLQGTGAPLALTARVSRALGVSRDTEVSAGYGLRARSFGLLVERRQRLDEKSGAFAVTGYGGLYDVKLPAGLRFDGFAQGGIAGLRQRLWFADGQARLTGRMALSSQFSLGAGGGAWASAQQGARRVEAGPLIEARVRTGAVGLRVAGEYRFRVTGDANPRSGPALTLGVDF